MANPFPSDDNGRVLLRMQENGDDLAKPRDIDFTVVFPGQSSAVAFADYFRRSGYKVSVEKTGSVPELPWDVIVVKHMIPSHNEIAEFENTLSDFASPLGGRNDGWGCFAQPTRH
ncbi:ribonuclease E inhibitor RraB [Paludibaculum fermentans]|uniref:Ribonuclease E inhibitor RraB n=1 Tax=Paludibaculum fermentans TaxID=1473598 RepID=A0A7S7SKD7_PALFE|nr:ribonuclease E inhibitor RraB [Paludibaculum fermentans]QOY86920.1 ribonuclease E inhibitor RraB [Paludibaculum fermentans]